MPMIQSFLGDHSFPYLFSYTKKCSVDGPLVLISNFMANMSIKFAHLEFYRLFDLYWHPCCHDHFVDLKGKHNSSSLCTKQTFSLSAEMKYKCESANMQAVVNVTATTYHQMTENSYQKRICVHFLLLGTKSNGTPIWTTSRAGRARHYQNEPLRNRSYDKANTVVRRFNACRSHQ